MSEEKQGQPITIKQGIKNVVSNLMDISTAISDVEKGNQYLISELVKDAKPETLERLGLSRPQIAENNKE